MAYPFYGKAFEFGQPDGSRIQVKGWGDQHHAVFESTDGYTIVKDPDTRYYCYARLSDDQEELISTGVKVGTADPAALNFTRGIRISYQAAKQKAMAAFGATSARRRCEVRRERARRYLMQRMSGNAPLMAPPRRETRGQFNGLCLLIEFQDEPGTIDRMDVDDFCNLQGYDGFGNNGSVYDYFLENSLGMMKYNNIVVPYYTAAHPSSYYANPSVPHGVRARELVKEALGDLKSRNFDFSRLSTDDEGYVYAVNVFYAGTVPNDWGEGLWPHSWSLQTPFALADGIKAFDYQITDMGRELSLGTFCHENGHMVCDYPDLYDYGYESRGVGHFCLMCAGGTDEKNPVNISGYLKYKSGWATRLTPLSGEMEVTLEADRNQFCIFPKSAAEYFLIENRHRSGRDLALPDSGLAVWHVDELGNNNLEHMTPTHHYECALEQADDRFDMERGLNNGDRGDLFSAPAATAFSDATSPGSKWWDGTPSGLVIRDIGESSRTMQFTSGRATDDGIRLIRENSTRQIEIPDDAPAGIEDRITVSADAALASIQVSVEIIHTYRGDLRVTLVSPSGTSVILHDRTGGGADNLRQTYDLATTPGFRELLHQPVDGPWTLRVQDMAPQDEGRLHRWDLELGVTATPSIIAVEDAAGINIPENTPAGVERTLTVEQAGAIEDVAVDLDISHTYIGDLVVTLTSPAGTRIDLHRRTGSGTDNIIRTFNRTSTPALELLSGEPMNGQWRLHVADLAPRDKGKLNRWTLKIRR